MKTDELLGAMQQMALKMEDVTDETHPESGEHFAFYLQNSYLMVFEGSRFLRFLPLERGENCEKLLLEYAESLGDAYNMQLLDVAKSGGDIEKPPTPHLYFADIDNIERCENNEILQFWERFEKKYCQLLHIPPKLDGDSMFFNLYALLKNPTDRAHAKAVKDILTFQPKEFKQTGTIAKWGVAAGIPDDEPLSVEEAFDQFIAAEEAKTNDWHADLEAAQKEIWEEANANEDAPFAEWDRNRSRVLATAAQKEKGLPSEIDSIEEAPKPKSNRIDPRVINGLAAVPAVPRQPQLSPSLEERFTQEVDNRGLAAPPEAEEKPSAGTRRKSRNFGSSPQVNRALVKVGAIAGEVLGGVVLWVGYVATGFACAALSGSAAELVSNVWFPLGGAAAVVIAKAIFGVARRKK